MSLRSKLKQENILSINMKALIAVLQKELELPRLQLQLTDEAKQELDAMAINNLGTDGEMPHKRLLPPYGHLTVTGIAIDKSRIPVKNVRRHGLVVGTEHATRRTVQKAYIFPATVSVDLHYFDRSSDEAFLTAQVLGILSVSSAFNFGVKYGSLKYANRVATLEDITIPTVELREGNTSIYDTSVTLMFETYMGLVQDVYAVNASQPITQGIAITTGSGSFVMRETVGVQEG